MEGLECPHTADGKVQLLWKTVRDFFRELNMELPYDPAISFLSTYPREQKNVLKAQVKHKYSQQCYS